MAHTPEDSVLMNLKALRDIGEDRVREAEEQKRLRDEQARLAVEEAERMRRADAERLVREAEAARQRQADEQAQREREAQLRLDEAERRARIDAETRLEEARLRLEIEARALHGTGKRPVGLILAAVVLLLGAAGLGSYAYQANQEAQASRRAAQQRTAELEAVNADIRRKQADLAKDATRRAQLEEEIRRLQEQKAAIEAKGAEDAPRPGGGSRPRPPRPAETPAVHIKMCPEGKPMCQEWEKR